MRTLLRVVSPILNLLFYITLLLMVLTWTNPQYPIKIASILGFWSTNCLVPPTGAELMSACRHTRERDYSLCLRFFPKRTLILTQ